LEGMPLSAAGLKAHARTLGFDLCGIAPAGDFPELDFLRQWLERGYAADMGWLARSADRRADRARVARARGDVAPATNCNNRPQNSFPILQVLSSTRSSIREGRDATPRRNQ
jgi:hypothetical protein